MTRTFFVVALAVTLTSCSASADTISAERAVVKFHELLDAGRFTEIFEQSSDDLKKASTQSDFVALLEAVHRKLGNTKSAVDQAWSVNHHTSGTFITLTYKAVYSEGEAAEQFLFRMQGDSARVADLEWSDRGNDSLSYPPYRGIFCGHSWNRCTEKPSAQCSAEPHRVISEGLCDGYYAL